MADVPKAEVEEPLLPGWMFECWRPPFGKRFVVLMDAMNHCVAKVLEIVARGEPDARSIFQLGYNLGRLSELTGRGREPYWDRWKGAVGRWDRAELAQLARQLHEESSAPSNPPT